MAFFHAWLETLERLTPPKYAVFGLPVSSRLMLLGGDGLKDMDIDELGLFHGRSFLGDFLINYSSEELASMPDSAFGIRLYSRPHARRTLSAV